MFLILSQMLNLNMFNVLLFTLAFRMVSQFKDYLFSVVKLYLKTQTPASTCHHS